jgi:hypothetical protein
MQQDVGSVRRANNLGTDCPTVCAERLSRMIVQGDKKAEPRVYFVEKGQERE